MRRPAGRFWIDLAHQPGVQTQTMNQVHRLPPQRFELKYLVHEAIASGIRDFVSSYLELDDYSVGRPNMSYLVHSLYLDSDDLDTFHASINCTKNRLNLRLRYYYSLPAPPQFFIFMTRY